MTRDLIPEGPFGLIFCKLTPQGLPTGKFFCCLLLTQGHLQAGGLLRTPLPLNHVYECLLLQRESQTWKDLPAQQWIHVSS